MDDINVQSLLISSLPDWLNYSDISIDNQSDVTLNDSYSLFNLSLTTDHELASSFTWDKIVILVFKAIVMTTIILVSIMGNVLVIVSISLNRKLQVMTNFFIASLAIADMLVALCAMTFNASQELFGKWHFGPIICELYNSFDVYFSTVSILHLCCISMDRYYAILNPLEYPVKVTKRIILFTLANVWVLPSLISFLPIFMGWYAADDADPENGSKNTGVCKFDVNQTFALLSSTFSFWLPCTVMVILYYRIYMEARKQESAILSRTNSMSTLRNINRGISPRLTLRRLISRMRARRLIRKANRAKQKQDFQMCPLTCHNRNRDRTHSIYSTASEINASCAIGNRESPCRCSFQHGGRLPPPPCIITEAADDDHVSSSSQVASIHGTLMALKDVSPDDTRETSITNGRNSELSCPSLSSGLLPSSTPRSSVNCNQLMIPMSNHMTVPVPTMRREHKAAKTLGIIMGTFILCWLPFFAWYVTFSLFRKQLGDPPEIVIPILFWIGYFNSTLNPFIYAYFRRDFREAFKKTLKRLQCCYNQDFRGGAYV